MLKGGWIKMHRRLLDWELYNDTPAFKTFIHLLLTVNVEDCTLKNGIVVRRGSRLSSFAKLAEETGQSMKTIRGAISRLERAGCVARSSTAKYTIFIVLNYDSYQNEGKTKGKERARNGAKKGHAEGQQSKNIRREEERSKEDISPLGFDDSSPSDLARLRRAMRGDTDAV